MHTGPRGHAGQLFCSPLPKLTSTRTSKSTSIPHRHRGRMQIMSYLSPTGLAAAGAMALAGLVTWGVTRFTSRLDGSESTRSGASDCRPEVLCEDNAFNKEVLERCGTIMSGYRRFWGILNGHIETVWGTKLRKDPRVKYVRELLRRPDGGTVSLDYFDPGDQPGLPENSPVVILMPGLVGGSDCRYVQYSALRAYEFGFRAVVFNSRGTAGTALTSAKFYSASFTDDTRGVVQHIAAKFPESVLLCMGWSLGGNILVNYLGEEGSKTPISAAVSLCNPFNLTICDKAWNQGINLVYNWNLGAGMSKLLRPNAHLFKDKPQFDLDQALNCRTVRDFDVAITHVSFGWKDVDEYYAKSGSHLSIPKVETPLLCIQALDDPIAVEKAIPREAIRNNPNCVLVTTPSGGHLGWVAGEGAPFKAPWTDLAAMEWLDSVVLQLGSAKSRSYVNGAKKRVSEKIAGRAL